MIKKVGLPCDAVQTRHASLPVADNGGHAGFPREDQQCVQVIRHEQEQLAPPAARCVILPGCINQETRQPELSQRSGLSGRCPDPDMEHRPSIHPFGSPMVQAQRVFVHAATFGSGMSYSTRFSPPPERVGDNAPHLPSYRRPQFPRWRALSPRRLISPEPTARWGQRAPPMSPRHPITSASPLTLKVTVEPSATSPEMSARASVVSIWRCRNRFNGRAPNTGS